MIDEMARLGLLTAGGSLIFKKGLSAWAFADDGSLTFVKGVDGPPSLRTTPWVQPMPILPIRSRSIRSTLTRCRTGRRMGRR